MMTEFPEIKRAVDNCLDCKFCPKQCKVCVDDGFYSSGVYRERKSRAKWARHMYDLFEEGLCEDVLLRPERYKAIRAELLKQADVDDELVTEDLEKLLKPESELEKYFLEKKEKETIFQEAQRVTHGARQQDYAKPEDNFKHIACIASSIMKREITAADCVFVMMAVKLSRERFKHKRDNLVDLSGYAWCLSRVEGDEK